MKSDTKKMRFQRRPGQASFTLVEMLVAMAILSIMLVFLGTLLLSVTTVSTNGTQEAQNADNARSILDLMNRELEAGVCRADMPNWISSSSSNQTLAYYTQNVGSALDTSTSNDIYRGLSFVAYALSNTASTSSLYRSDSAVLWTTSNTADLPLSSTNTFTQSAPTTSNSADILDGVLAFQVTYMQSDGTYTTTYSSTCVAVGVSLAMVNSTTYNLLINSGQLSNLSTALTSAATSSTGLTPKIEWEQYINGQTTATPAFSTFPQQVKTGLRFYERFTILPTPPL